MKNAIEITETREKHRILIVDDDLDFATSLQDIIESRWNCRVEIAGIPQEARQCLTSFLPEIILIDVRLGNSDGTELLAEFTSHMTAPTCVMITGYSSTDSAVNALHAGAYDYLTKPVAPKMLFVVLDRCFERIRLERESADALNRLESRNRELEHINQRLNRVVECMGVLSSSTTLTDLCRKLLVKVASNMGVEGGSIYIRDGDQLMLKHSLDPGHAPAVLPMPLNAGSVLGRVVERGEAVLVSDATSSEGLMLSGWSGYRDESLLALPLVGQDGAILGVLSLHTKHKPPFTRQDCDVGRILLAASCETLRAVTALEELQASEEHIRLLLNSTHDGIYGLDFEGNCTFANASCLQILGYEEEDLFGMNVLELVHHLQIKDMSSHPGECEVCNVLTDEISDNNQAEMWRADGTSFTAECASDPVFKKGTVTGCVVTFRDISDRIAIENELEESRKMQQLIIDSLPDCVKVLDRDHNVLHLNPAGLAMIEVDPSTQFEKDCSLDFIDPEYHESYKRMMNDVSNGEAAMLECSITGQHGTRRWLDMISVPLRNCSQEIIGSLCIARDISQRREMQNELHKSQSMLQLIIDSVPECVKVLDRDGNIIQMNRAGLDMSQADTFDQVDGTCLYHQIRPENKDALRQMNDRVFQEGVEGKIEYVLIGLKGRELELTSHVVPLRNADQEIIGVLGVSRDITESRKMIEKTRQQELQLMQANKIAALGTLVAGVAHEINNPNQTIQINAGLMVDVWNDVEGILDQHVAIHGDIRICGLPYSEVRAGYADMVRDIKNGAEQIRTVVDRLRSFARPDGGIHKRARGETVQINEAIETALALLGHAIRKGTDIFIKNLAEDLPEITGNQQHFQQIVINLVLNSLESLPGMSSALKVETRLDTENACILLSVIDEGVGIQAEDLDRIMEPFFTTKRDIGGTGLGLSITHTLVGELGGTMEMESEPGKGTRVTVSLPVVMH